MSKLPGNEEFYEIPKSDKEVLRELGEKVFEIATSSVNEEYIELQKAINRLERVKPIIYIYEIPWHEVNLNGELDLKTKHPLCRRYEERLRRIIYKWDHCLGAPVDDPRFTYPGLEPVIAQPIQDYIHDSGYGIRVEEDVLRRDERNPIVSHRFHAQIKSEEDIEKIKMPKVTFDYERAERDFQALCDIFDGIMPVEKRGVSSFWFAPWDEIVQWTGVKEILIDMFRRPSYVHKLIDRMVEAWLYRLEQYVRLGLMRDDPMKLWGVETAQVFAAASPSMHEEFALRHEKPWYEKWGYNYYGCCEPLHHKVDILRRNVPRLRKISISPFADFHQAAKNIRDEFVIAWKPSPAVLAASIWDPESVRKDIEEKLRVAKEYNCIIEIHLKDISTVNYQPQRLWEWAQIASKVAGKYA
ncbi:MAG: hypothetical protein N3E47_05300 [Candidatus Bathyarchaeota archaeon]|nr:hypothetical protein [Candidatus Bathyarchaeota archaeon]